MKKTLLAMMMTIATSLSANAQTICVVMAEGKPNEYTELLASKILDGSENNQVVYQNGNTSYGVTQEEDGSLVLMIYDATQEKIFAGAVSEKTAQLTLFAPELHKTFGCSEINTSK